MRKAGGSYGSSSRWTTLGSHKMLFVMGLTMFPVLTDANVLPSSTLPRVRIQGYDCAKPERIRSSAVPQHCSNWKHSMDAPPKDPVQQYEILQKRTKIQLQGHVCSLRVSQSFRYCGIWSYEKEIAPPTVYEQQELTPEECRRMLQYKKIELPGGNVVAIKAPGLTYADIVPEGELSVDQGSASCQGADLMHRGKLLKSVLQLMSAEVRVEKVEMEAEMERDGRVWRRDSGTLLMCKVTAQGCKVKEGILIWNAPPTVCPYEVIRTISATMTAETLQGTGQDRIWLPLDQEIQVGLAPCPKSRLWSTSVPRLFVGRRSAAETRRFPALDAIEVDLVIQTAVQQLYLQHQMAKALEPVASDERLRCQMIWQ